MKNYAKYIDHTILKRDAVTSDIDVVISEAKKYGFASICSFPIWIEYIKKNLQGTDVLTCAVVGFPYGTQTTETKISEGIDAIKKGADELDYVAPISKIHEFNDAYINNELNKIREATKGTTIKLIIETGLLNDEEKKYITKLALNANWDFVKTSTGINTTGATVSDVKLMKEIVGNNAEIKASGGVKTLAQTEELIKAGATRIGSSNGVLILEGKEVTSGY